MNDIVTFVNARLNEDEQAARDATWHEDAGTWRTAPTPYETRGAAQRWYIEDSLDDGVVSHVDPQASDDEGVARHIARHDPARVLREVEAKRRILDIHASGNDPCDAHDASMRSTPCDTLRLLAEPYDGEDGYKEDWRP